MTRIVVLGCGYVGCELARGLDEHAVVGVRRSDAGLAAVEAAGAQAVRADVTDPESLTAVPDADWLVFAASAGGRDVAAARETYVEGLRTTVEHFAGRDAPPDRLVYTSSTGVYGDHDGAWVDEEAPLDPATEKAQVLAEAERIALDASGEIDGTVARLGGLYGPDRYRLDRYLDGPVAPGYLNLVHRDDAAGAIAFLLASGHVRDGVVNVVGDPVERWAFADWLAEQCGEPSPPKRSGERADASRRSRADKRVSNDRLQRLGYAFSYPTVREGYREAIEAHRADERLD